MLHRPPTRPTSIWRSFPKRLPSSTLCPGRRGYFTEVFCERARYLRPENGARVDAIRDAIEERYRASWLYPVVLTSLLEAADRVDSTTGLQMAYLKQWAPRSFRPLALRVPELLAGAGPLASGRTPGTPLRAIGPVDFAYLDPPYNQHRYFTNYHVWETLVRWDCAGALRSRVQACRLEGRRHPKRLQLEGDDAARPRRGGRQDRRDGRRRVVQRRVVARP